MKARDPNFARNLGFISEEEQEQLINSKVAIAGAGGDGGMLAIQLARLGVGEIRLADPDPFEAENINRQARATARTIGHNKARTIGEYICEINPNIVIKTYENGITFDNCGEFIDGTDLLIDETEFTLHAIGVALARQARAANIPNLMALNIGFGTAVTTYHPEGRTFERALGLSVTDELSEIAQQKVPLSRWLPYIPPYGDIDVFKSVASGQKPAPSIGPGVNIASAVGSSQAFLNLVQEIDNHRPRPVYAPKVMVMDAMTGESKNVKQSSSSFYRHIAKMALSNFTGRAPQASY